jgi:hypothetical protein
MKYSSGSVEMDRHVINILREAQGIKVPWYDRFWFTTAKYALQLWILYKMVTALGVNAL